jgi:hypothetical protein
MSSIRNPSSGIAHVDMEAEDQQFPHHILHLLLQELVPVLLGDQLVLPPGEGMSAGGNQSEAGPRQDLEQR